MLFHEIEAVMTRLLKIIFIILRKKIVIPIFPIQGKPKKNNKIKVMLSQLANRNYVEENFLQFQPKTNNRVVWFYSRKVYL